MSNFDRLVLLLLVTLLKVMALIGIGLAVFLVMRAAGSLSAWVVCYWL